MKQTILKNAVCVQAGGSGGHLVIKEGLIAEPGGPAANVPAVDAEGSIIFPGFIDIHIHGAVGIDVNAASADELMKMAAFLARNGVTAWMPTLVPDSDENFRRVIDEIDRLMELQAGKPVAQAVGVHYEGVFANEKMCGALRPEYFKKFTVRELDELPRLRKGSHMMTFAPEVESGVALATELARQGWIASIGHTRADIEILNAAFAAGARHMTHFFNAMTGIHHRGLGVAGWGLTQSDITFDIIADGVHVHPEMLKLACGVKGPDKVALISDSVAPTGLGDGEFDIWGEKVSVADRRTLNERGSIAGSVITMHDAFLKIRSLGFSDVELAQMTSANPAKLLGLEDSRGAVEAGKRADLVGIRPDGSIKFVMIGGEFVDLG